jgi:hypothetical protein
MSQAENKAASDPDEPADFDPLNAPLPELDRKERQRLKRKAYLRDYHREYSKKRNTGRPPGRPPKPKQTEPARPKNYESIWSPQYKEDGTPGPQFALLSCPFPEIFFGGARGGGKTDGAIGKWLQHAHRYGPDAKGVFFRRRFKQLEEVQARCSALFPRIGATYHKGDANWVFPNGALLKLRHLWDVSATEEYQGHNYSWLCFEELTNWSTPDAIDRMRGTLRSAKGVPVELIMTGNPGGSGHCVPYGEVLTPTGWKDISHFQVGDPVMTVTDKGEIVQSEASQVHKSHYTGMMAAISGSGVTMVCTPNHKIGVVNSSKSKITLKPFNQLGSGFSIPRVLSRQGKESRLDESGRSELHITAEAVKMLDFEGDIYCIGVAKTHSFIIRQNGFIWVSGNSWVKNRFISPAPQGWTPIKDEETGAYRIYIPSRLEDNTAMMKNDPTYAARLRGTGSAALVNAWLKGDWDIVAGGFFDDLIVPDIHFLTPFHIPSTWSYRRSFDWGSASPASLGIWAVSDGNPVPDLDGFTFPRGSLIRIKEWYTVAKTKNGDIVPNEGLRLTNLALGEGIAQRSLGYRFSGCVADPSIYSKLGRESIYDEMRKGAADAGHNLIMSPADNNRIGGWQKMRDMLENARADRPEKPGLWVFETCHHWLRTVPVMQRSDTDFDDVDTTQEDHCLHGNTLVETSNGNLPIRDLVGQTGTVRQADGSWRAFYDCRLTRAGAKTISIETRDGRSITCTPDHLILTTEGWIEAEKTLGKTIVCVHDGNAHNVSHQEAGSEGYGYQRDHSGVHGSPVLPVRPVLPEGWTEIAHRGVGAEIRPGDVWLSRPSQGRGQVEQSVEQSGSLAGNGAQVSPHEAAGQGGSVQGDHQGRQISRIGMAWLTRRPGLALQALSRKYRAAEGGFEGSGLRRVRSLLPDIHDLAEKFKVLLQQMQIGGETEKRRGRRAEDLRGVPSAVHDQQVHQDQDMQSPVQRQSEVGSDVVSIRDGGTHDVFNLEVEGTHAFAVNGGLIVHNCADDTRYVCMTGARQLKIGALVGR